MITPAFGHQRNAPGDRILFLADVDRLAFPENLPSGLGETTKQALHELTAPRADQTVKPYDLTRPDPHGNVLEALTGEFFRAKNLGAERNRLLVVDLFDRAIDHAGDERLLVGFGDALGRNQLAIAKDRDAVRELEHFFQPMRNINNSDALGLKTTDQCEELRGLLTGQIGRRLVENEEACAARSCACRRDQLLLADGQAGKYRAGRLS